MDLVAELWAAEDMSVREPSEAELLDARVDLLPSPDGPLLLELELAEPSPFLDHHLPAVDTLADAILDHVRGARFREHGSVQRTGLRLGRPSD